jgi:hypothetical protein
MRCALVDNLSSLVVNLIIADPAIDTPPEGFILIGLSDEDPVGIGWSWDGSNFIDPTLLNTE